MFLRLGALRAFAQLVIDGPMIKNRLVRGANGDDFGCALDAKSGGQALL